jgi:hypothetical protein
VSYDDRELEARLRTAIDRRAVPDRPLRSRRPTTKLPLQVAAALALILASVFAGNQLQLWRTSVAAPSPASLPTRTAASAPLVKIRLAPEYRPYARISPDGRFAVGERMDWLGLTLFRIAPPAAGSDTAQLVEVARLSAFLGGALWLPDSSGILIDAVFDSPLPPRDKMQSPPRPRELTLMEVSGSVRRTTARISDLFVVRPGTCFSPCLVNLSPDGMWIPFVDASSRLVAISRDGSALRVIADRGVSNLGWDHDGNLLVSRTADASIDALRADGSVAYTIGAPKVANGLRPGVVRQSPDRVAALVDFGMMGRETQHFVLVDRTLRVWPSDLEPYPAWIGNELVVMRKSDRHLLAYAPASGDTRDLNVTLLPDSTIWGQSGDFLAWRDRLTNLRTGVTLTLPILPTPELVEPLHSGLFALRRREGQSLLDANLLTSATLTSSPLRTAVDQTDVPAGRVRVENVDGGWSVVIPTSWTAVAGFDDGAEITSFAAGSLPVDQPLPLNAAQVRIRITSNPQQLTPRDFASTLLGHGSAITLRKGMTVAGQQGDFVQLFENTLYPRAGTTLNWLVPSPFRGDRMVHVKAWPDGDLRAEIEALVASLRLFTIP